MDTQLDESVEIVTLVLGENKIDVHKEKLARKSRYFASLFSHNFYDSQQKEHVINYDISLSTLQDFINWIHIDDYIKSENDHYIKPCMTKFLTENFVELLSLLQLSVLFTIDNLTNDVVELIILHWLRPDRVINIWLLAQELSLNVLRDVCLAVCLDRFHDLPASALIELPKQNILQLIENDNVRCSKHYLNYVLSEWSRYHMDPGITDVTEIKGPKFLQCMNGYKFDEFLNKKGCIYCWNGIQLDELVELKELNNSDKDIIGMQITGRGFSIYMIGGEQGLGTGQFNTIIWRYCLISKKWYYQARLPVPRRHMVVAFLNYKLMVIGGVGRHRVKLSTVDVLNIHTGEWGKAANVPEVFTEVPYHCVMKGRLFLLKSSVYIYYPDTDCWKTILLSNISPVHKADVFMVYDSTLFLTGTNHLGETILSRINNSQDSMCNIQECSKLHDEDTTMVYMCIVREDGEDDDDEYELKCAYIAGICILLLGKHCMSGDSMHLHLHSEKRKDLHETSLNPKLGCFNVIDPSSLYKKNITSL